MAVKHINITMPDNLINKMDRFAKRQKTTRSNFIRVAVIKLMDSLQSKVLRDGLKKGYLEMAKDTLKMTEDMHVLEEESMEYIGDDKVEW